MAPTDPFGFRYEFIVLDGSRMHKLVFANGSELVVSPKGGDQADMVMVRPRPDDARRRMLSHCRLTTREFDTAQRRAAASDWTTVESWSDPEFNHHGKMTLNPLPQFIAIFDRCWPGGDSPTLEWLLENGALVPHDIVPALFRPARANGIQSE